MVPIGRIPIPGRATVQRQMLDLSYGTHHVVTMTREPQAWSAQRCGAVDFTSRHVARDVLWEPECGGTFSLEPSGTRLKATFFFSFQTTACASIPGMPHFLLVSLDAAEVS